MLAKHQKLGDITGVYYWALEDFALDRLRVNNDFLPIYESIWIKVFQ